jgi:hypothetical protein
MLILRTSETTIKTSRGQVNAKDGLAFAGEPVGMPERVSMQILRD